MTYISQFYHYFSQNRKQEIAGRRIGKLVDMTRTNDELKSEIYRMFTYAVDLEDKVIDLAYEMGGSEGLVAAEVKQYIRYIADRRLLQLGLKPIFNVKDNPLTWLDWIINGDSFKNFFEGVVTDYNASGMTGEWGWD